MNRTRPTALIVTGFLALTLAACGNAASSSSSGTASGSPAASGPASPVGCPLAVTDAWAKAADTGMTAAFGTVSNQSGQPVTVTSASTPAAGKTELHETVGTGSAMTMKQVSMFEIPANGKLVLEPGGNHIMLMNIPAPIKPGQDVTVTLTCESGGTAQFTAKARTYSGANETYSPGSPSSQMSMPAAPSADMSMPSTTN